MKQGKYAGERKDLHGRTALLREHLDDDTKYLVQFDTMNIPEAFGWHEFNKEEFIDVR